jgi:Ca2+-transporting ATPase
MEKEEWDGKVSIEHQLDIHIRDLLQCERFGDEVGEILTGLQYVVDYRLREHQQQNLDSVISDRLVRALLLFTGIHVKSGLFGMEKRLSDIAEMSFALLADFCAKVAECNRALLAIPTEESSIRLRLGSRILKPSNPAIFSAAISLLHTLTARGDWREFFNDADYDEVHVRLERANFFNTEDVQSKRSFTTVTIYPPPALYFDRDPNRVLDMFQTRLEGLDSSTEVSTLRNYHGMNELPIASARPVWKVFVSQFADFMILILIVTTIGSAIVDYPHVESTIILGLVVLLNVLVGFWQELKSSRTIAAMRSLQIPLVRLLRVHLHLYRHGLGGMARRWRYFRLTWYPAIL